MSIKSKMFVFSLLLLAVAWGEQCNHMVVDFVVLDGDATLLALEDDIRADLEALNITVNLQLLEKDDLNAAMTAGEFNLAFSETWGPPYDPHSFAASWNTPDEAYYSALQGLPDVDELHQMIDDVLSTEGEAAREDGWEEILSTLHEFATELPFSGKRIPAVISSRLSGFGTGLQQFDYPMHTLTVSHGSINITVAPGGQTGLFEGVGRLDPHTYRPNEFFSNNWVYDGLVEYGPNGQILPSLATEWEVEDLDEGGQKYTFALRQGVVFHDGTKWNCSAAELNFDHVLAPPLTTGDWHGWYNLPQQINGWQCLDEYTFELTTTDAYYPLLQELCYIRPLRMLSPTMFVGGWESDPLTQNSCDPGWGTAELDGVTVTCAGTLGIAGTGRWTYIETIAHTEDQDGEDVEVVDEVIFERNMHHWEAPSTDSVQFMRLIRHDDAAAVNDALLAGNLDVVVGDGVLEPADLEDYRVGDSPGFNVYLTEPLQNRIIVLNTNRAPTDDLTTRKIIIHAVDKAAIIEQELGSLAEPVDQLFPVTAPYCDVHLTPTWSYDLEKATLLNCPAVAAAEDSPGMGGGALIGIVVGAIVVVAMLVFILFLISREKQGKPVFYSLVSPDDTEMNGVAKQTETSKPL